MMLVALESSQLISKINPNRHKITYFSYNLSSNLVRIYKLLFQKIFLRWFQNFLRELEWSGITPNSTSLMNVSQDFFIKFRIKLFKDVKQTLMLMICLTAMSRNVLMILMMLLNVERDGGKSIRNLLMSLILLRQDNGTSVLILYSHQ